MSAKFPKKKDAPTQSPLTGRGGVSLIEFQLARRGYEHVRTDQRSACGDIWAQTDIGRISIEVKTTQRGLSWFVKPSQLHVEIFCLVNLSSGTCHILTSPEMAEVLAICPEAHPGIRVVSARVLPIDSLEGWHRLGSHHMPGVSKVQRKRTYGSTRTVTRKMKNGDLKTYVYPPSPPTSVPILEVVRP